MHDDANNSPDIDTELINRGLMPTGHAGPEARAFIETAPTPDVDRFRGALLGGACGDALGHPVTGMTPEQIQRQFGRVRHFLPAGRRGRAGTISGDTQFALWVAQALTGEGDDYAAQFAQTLSEQLGSLRQIGRGTQRAVTRLLDGKPWWRSGNPSAGNGVAMRGAALGLAFGADPDILRREVARNAVITHADPLAVASGIVQAYAVARLARTAPGTLDPHAFISELVAVVHGIEGAGGAERRNGSDTRVRLVDRIAELADMLELTPAEAFAHTHNGGYVLESLPAALWAFLSNRENPEAAIVTAANGGYDADTVASMSGALAGAYHGESGLPARWLDELEAAAHIRTLANRVHRRHLSRPEAPTAGQTAGSVADADRVHVSVLLDRSGSMNSIADDTIGGFNTFLAEQRKVTGDCRITLVQFDGHDPQEIVADAVPVAEMIDLTDQTYQPRSNTPLLDATGMLIERLDRRAASDPDEYQLVAIITDGHENASREFTRAEIARMIGERDDAGWTFVFLGANIDSFAEAQSMGMRGGQSGDWEHNADGIAHSFDQLSYASTRYRNAGPADRRSIQHHIMDHVRDELPPRTPRPRRS